MLFTKSTAKHQKKNTVKYKIYFFKNCADYDKSIFASLLLGVGYAFLIGVISWVGSFSLYGYGQHIEDTQAIRKIIESEQRKKLTENSD